MNLAKEETGIYWNSNSLYILVYFCLFLELPPSYAVDAVKMTVN